MRQTTKLFELAASCNHLGMTVTRVGLVVVLVWIGGLKAYRYEGEGIVPFVANSPFMNFLYQEPAGEYKQHLNREGELVAANREWHKSNGTYLFAYGLGSVIVAFGIMIALHPWLPQVSAIGSFLVFLMSLVTLSFLITTPEAWVPALGSSEHGFPLLSGAGRLVIKDIIMADAALLTMADSANLYLQRNIAPTR
jgi:reactive chlorine resistance protein C